MKPLPLRPLVAAFALCITALSSYADQPNVLFIGIDDLRPELHCYGAKHIHSPNIDRLASEGVLFEKAYCQWAVCMPSRASLLSGLRPDSFKGKANAFRKIVPDVVTLPQHFKNHGYFTQSFGKIFHGAWKTAYVGDSFQDPVSWSVERWASSPRYYFSPEGVRVAKDIFANANDQFLRKVIRDPNDPDQWTRHFVRGLPYGAPDVADDLPADGAIANAALERLRKLQSNPDRPPFFLAVGFCKPHLPFVAPKKYWDLYDPETFPSVEVTEPPKGAPDFALRVGAAEVNQYVRDDRGPITTEEARQLRHGYAACVSYVDAQVGRLLDELDEQGIRDETIVVLWSDHGYKLGDLGSWAKHTNFELDTRVPLIISAPGLAKNERSEAVVELVDLHPTVSELAGLPVHAGAEGESFAKNVAAPNAPGQEEAFSQFPKGGFMGYTIRTATHRYTEWRDAKRNGHIAGRELYEYEGSNVETENLTGQKQHAELQNELKARLAGQFENGTPSAAAKIKKPEKTYPVGLHAGAAATNIDPPKLPVLQNGGFAQRITNTIFQSLYARSLVLKNGETTIAICVVDSCMLPRELCDKAKALVEKQIGITADRILISATHTHAAPSAMRTLGSQADPNYPSFLIPKIAESIAVAHAKLQPAEAGSTVANAESFTNPRRWIFLPHKMQTDPYGKVTVRAMMHPGHQNPTTAGPSGPEDPDLTLLSIRTRDGKPLAVLGNLSQHYYSRGTLSSGFTGTFCKLLEEEYGDGFVGIMSQGTSGDLQWKDYSKPPREGFLGGEEDHYTAWNRALADLAIQSLDEVTYQSDCAVAMDEQKLPLSRRLPDEERVTWAKPIVEELGDRLPRSRPEVLATEVFWMQENPTHEVKLQTLRVGGFGIATLPNEVYGITGLKLKLQSPLQPLMVIELANGGAGYIPPPEQHHLGGYTTWPARTAGLEVQAEPRMVKTLLASLEVVSGKVPVKAVDKTGPYGEKILDFGPRAWWRMSSHSGNLIPDASGNGSLGNLEPGFALFLPGPEVKGLESTPRGNRAVQFAGGRMVSATPELNRASDYSVSLWFWNAMPHNARPVTGYMFSLGKKKDRTAGDHLGITGKALGPPGRLLFFNGNQENTAVIGKTKLGLQQWHHLLLVRQGKTVRIHLDGNTKPEIDAEISDTRPDNDTTVFVGGRADGLFPFEGKIDEVAIFDSVLEAGSLTP